MLAHRSLGATVLSFRKETEAGRRDVLCLRKLDFAEPGLRRPELKLAVTFAYGTLEAGDGAHTRRPRQRLSLREARFANHTVHCKLMSL